MSGGSKVVQAAGEPREPLPRRLLRADRHFHWRGRDVSRIEALSDAVFALVLALLFLQSAPPATLPEVFVVMKSLIPFGITFVLLTMLWWEHYLFFRRYDLQSRYAITLNLLLLFLVLLYAYPLKFMFTFLSVQMLGPIGDLTWDSMIADATPRDGAMVLAFYSAGFAAIYAVYWLLYRHAWRKRDDLELDEVERHLTRTALHECWVYIGFGLLSIALALGVHPALGGLVYFGIGPVMGVLGYRRGRQLERLVEARGEGVS